MIFSDRVYDVLKWICIVVLPALATLYAVVARVWGLPYATEIPATVTAIAAFLGALVGVSSIQYYSDKEDLLNG